MRSTTREALLTAVEEDIEGKEALQKGFPVLWWQLVERDGYIRELRHRLEIVKRET